MISPVVARHGMSCETLSVYPDEIEFLDVRPNQTYIQTVEIKNKLHSTCSFRMRPSNAERITIEPSTLSLAPGETKRVQVKFKLQGKPLPKKKGGGKKTEYDQEACHGFTWAEV